jgi:hypothetical protein
MADLAKLVCKVDPAVQHIFYTVGSQSPHKNLGSHIDASHSRQPLVKGERLVRYEVNAVMPTIPEVHWLQIRCEYMPSRKAFPVNAIQTRSGS